MSTRDKDTGPTVATYYIVCIYNISVQLLRVQFCLQIAKHYSVEHLSMSSKQALSISRGGIIHQHNRSLDNMVVISSSSSVCIHSFSSQPGFNV